MVGPGQGGGGVSAHLARVGELGGQVGPAAHVVPLVAGVVVEDGGHLLPGDGGVGPEGLVGVAVDDLLRGGPADGLGIPAGGHVGEGHQVIDHRLAFHPPEDGDNHAPGGGAAGGEKAAAHAVHQLVGVNVGHLVVEPVLLLDVGEGQGSGGAAHAHRGIGQLTGTARLQVQQLHAGGGEHLEAAGGGQRPQPEGVALVDLVPGGDVEGDAASADGKGGVGVPVGQGLGELEAGGGLVQGEGDLGGVEAAGQPPKGDGLAGGALAVHLHPGGRGGGGGGNEQGGGQSRGQQQGEEAFHGWPSFIGRPGPSGRAGAGCRFWGSWSTASRWSPGGSRWNRDRRCGRAPPGTRWGRWR